MFRVGDRVKIAKTSNYYDETNGKDSGNPPNVEGYVDTVVEHDYLPFKVKWDTGKQNSYREIDLELITTVYLIKLESNSLYV